MSSGTDSVGNYRKFHLIRAGKVYEIWAVRPLSENVLYAIKWLPPGERYTRLAFAELKHEFTVGKTLDHPCVIKTYDFGTSNNGAYMLLEYFKTPNLKQQIVGNNAALQPRVKEILINCARGMAYMHSQGWVHRDIKPDNFLVADNNEVKLIDFNLAKRIPSGLGKIFGGKSKVQGTHSYMAPEQIRGQQVGPQADVYSFGCMAYEVFNGRPPFTANSFNELLSKHLKTKPPELTLVNKNITPESADFVKRMMAKEAKDRPATMKDVEMELKTLRIFYTPPAAVDAAAKPAPKNDE